MTSNDFATNLYDIEVTFVTVAYGRPTKKLNQWEAWPILFGNQKFRSMEWLGLKRRSTVYVHMHVGALYTRIYVIYVYMPTNILLLHVN